MSRVSSAIYGELQGPSSFRAQDKLFRARDIAALAFPITHKNVVFRLYDFTEPALDTTNVWTVNKTAGATANFAKSAGDNGRITANTSATISQVVAMLQTADWHAAQNCGMEVRYQVDVVTNLHLEAGFVDVTTATNALCVSGIDTPAVTNGTTNAALIAMDTGQTTLKTLAAISATGGTVAKAALGTLAPTAATYQTLRVQCVGSTLLAVVEDNNGVEQARSAILAGVGTAALLPWIAFSNLSAAGKNPIIDYVALWQDRA